MWFSNWLPVHLCIGSVPLNDRHPGWDIIVHSVSSQPTVHHYEAKQPRWSLKLQKVEKFPSTFTLELFHCVSFQCGERAARVLLCGTVPPMKRHCASCRLWQGAMYFKSQTLQTPPSSRSLKTTTTFVPSFPGILSRSSFMCLTCTLAVLISITGQIYDRFHTHNGHHNSAEIQRCGWTFPLGRLHPSCGEIMHIDSSLPHVCHCRASPWPHYQPCDEVAKPWEELGRDLWPLLKEDMLQESLANVSIWDCF